MKDLAKVMGPTFSLLEQHCSPKIYPGICSSIFHYKTVKAYVNTYLIFVLEHSSANDSYNPSVPNFDALYTL